MKIKKDNKIQKINSSNKKELEFLKDTLENLIDKGYDISIPEILSINKTESNYVKNKKNKSVIVVNELEKAEYNKIDSKDTLIISLVITK